MAKQGKGICSTVPFLVVSSHIHMCVSLHVCVYLNMPLCVHTVYVCVLAKLGMNFSYLSRLPYFHTCGRFQAGLSTSFKTDCTINLS